MQRQPADRECRVARVSCVRLCQGRRQRCTWQCEQRQEHQRCAPQSVSHRFKRARRALGNVVHFGV